MNGRRLASPNRGFRQCALVWLLLAGCSKPPMVASSAVERRTNHVQTVASATQTARVIQGATAVGAPDSHVESPLPPAAAVTENDAANLPLDSFEPAVLRLADERGRAPLFVITHGAGGTAQWHCDHYAALLGSKCTLLCLRGKRQYASDPSRGYYYPNHLALGQELRAARAALLEHYADRIDPNAVYIGYSQGASMGALAVAEHGDWFARMLLVEGGYESWSGALAKKYADTGGRRVLFVCGTARCRKLAAASVALLRQHHVEAQLRVAPGAGHRPDGPVAQQVQEGLAWLLADTN